METQVESKPYSDKRLVEGLLKDDEAIVKYFFYEKCSSLLGYIISHIFDYRIDKDELINELYIYLKADNGYKIRQFDYRSKFITWISVVSIRFFLKNRTSLIAKEEMELLSDRMDTGYNPESSLISGIDIGLLLNGMSNERYRYVLQALVLNDCSPESVANEMNITIDNLYNLKKRALTSLIQGLRNEVYGT